MPKDAIGSTKKSIRESFKDVNWKNVLSLENAFSTFLSVVVGIVIIMIAHTLGKMASRATKKRTDEVKAFDQNRFKTEKDEDAVEQKRRRRRESDTTKDEDDYKKHGGVVSNVASSLVYWGIVMVGALVILVFFGVQVASLVALVSTVLIVIGLSLQGTLNDIASGFLLSFYQTYDIGDVIKVNDVEGWVRDVRLVNTLIEDIGSRALITVPNNKIQSSTVRNLSRNRYHHFIFEVRLSNVDRSRDGKKVDYASITDEIRKELGNKKKYPAIVRHKEVNVLCGVSGMDQEGTKILVAVPFVTGPELFLDRGGVMTGVRDKLNAMGLRLMDRDYTYISRDEREAED